MIVEDIECFILDLLFEISLGVAVDTFAVFRCCAAMAARAFLNSARSFAQLRPANRFEKLLQK